MTDWLQAPLSPRPLALLRVLTSAYATIWLVARWPHLADVADFPDGRWHPVGVLAPFDGPPSATVILAVAMATVLLGLACTLGWHYRWCAPAFAVGLLVVTTWRTSWGNVLHTEPLLVLHVAVLALAPAAAVWSLDARRSVAGEPAPASRFAWPVRVMALITVSTYVVAGVAKLRLGGMDWITGDVLLHQVAYDNVRKEALGDTSSPIGLWAVGYPLLFRPLGLASLVVELGAPLALLSRRAAGIWTAAAWLFHFGVLALMAILFPYQLTLVGLAPVLLASGWMPRRLRSRVTPPQVVVA